MASTSSGSDADTSDTSDGHFIPPTVRARRHRSRRRREAADDIISRRFHQEFGYETAFLRSPVSPRSPSSTRTPQRRRSTQPGEDEGLRQISLARPVDPDELDRLLQRHLDSQELAITEEPAPISRPAPALVRASAHQGKMASLNAFPSLDTSMGGGNRTTTSPTTSHTGSVNGNGVGASAGYVAPLPVGHQQDLNYLYSQIQELGSILRSNREKVNVITRTAEEVARRANGALTENEGENVDNDKARIRELELELAKSKHLVELYKHEQKENTNLIAMYEVGMGTATEQIRNYTGDLEGRFLRQRKHYNDLLQQEKDDHLQSRLDRDHWYAQTLKVCEMIRTAFRLRTDEWCEEYTIIAGLQSEVRCLRRCLGMEPERPEDETGWPYLKDLPLNDQA